MSSKPTKWQLGIVTLTILFITFQTYNCDENGEIFDMINKNTLEFNRIASDIAWKSSIDPDDQNLPRISGNYQKNRIMWQQSMCDRLATLNWYSLNETYHRMAYLLCRGPRFSFQEASNLRTIYNELQSIYANNKICIQSENIISKSYLSELEREITKYLNKENPLDLPNDSNKIVCLVGESEVGNMMAMSRNEEVLKWLWASWREMGSKLKKPYEELVKIENMAARRNGYTDIGEAWREDLEVPKLRSLCRRLYNSIKPLYTLLHGVARFFLRIHYGNIVPERGYIPAHLFGDLWSQNWDSIIDIMTPQSIDLDDSMKRQNWTVFHMVKRAEDFYQSLGLPAMTETFWRESVFTQENGVARCHGAAADMFKDGDYRLIYCAGTTMQDFYVLHHEMGHIQYYIAYEDQPGLFRQANTALHESIGDSIMYGVMTPQHLHRLGLINDSVLYDNGKDRKNYNFNEVDDNIERTTEETFDNKETEINENVFIDIESTDDLIVLKQALNKIPQIPFSLITDEYRWQYFEGNIDKDNENSVFWNMVQELSGITYPVERGEKYFDVGAKFHVPDNTPYIRYFLSSFLQHQIFEGLCKAAVFGRRDVTEDVPDTITPNRCDIYGSKSAGKILRDLMSQGHSEHWRIILSSTLGIEEISSESLLRYYRRLQDILQRFVVKYHVPIGW
ncbi:angiotensin-converting enzyme [Amyelois transitella]|uniref:angiotensin-converting enzyme n=1 Tax=Amyelois transitella TaxID=680683 RepID=UPI00067B64E7|nr:angiotensin-converting enzyme [Amyelois transitella]